MCCQGAARAGWSLWEGEPGAGSDRCGTGIAVTKVQSHSTQRRTEQVWWWWLGSANSPGVARQIPSGETGASPSWEVKSMGQTQDWISGVHGQASTENLGRDQGQGQKFERSFQARRVDNHPPSYSSFSHHSFINSLNAGYTAAWCLCWLEDSQISGSRGMGLHSGYGKCLQLFPTSVFIAFFILISFIHWNV